jgi:hypothetical protein
MRRIQKGTWFGKIIFRTFSKRALINSGSPLASTASGHLVNSFWVFLQEKAGRSSEDRANCIAYSATFAGVGAAPT